MFLAEFTSGKKYDQILNANKGHTTMRRKKHGLTDGSDSEHDFEANFRHRGCKRHKIVTPTDIGVRLRDDFFDDIESCLT